MIVQAITKPQQRGIPYENPKIPLSDPAVMAYLSGHNTSSAGVNVSRETAMGLSAFWRGVSLISRTVAKVNCTTYKKKRDDSREESSDHPATKVLKYKSNKDTTSFVFKATLQAHALIHGNGYAVILRDENGDVTEMLPLDPTATLPQRDERTKELKYRIWMDSKEFVVPAENMLHIKGLSHDGIVGYSVIDTLREMLGHGIALQKYGAVFFRNNARPSIVIQLPAGVKLRDQAAVERLRESWGRVHEGLENSHKPAILEDGAAVHQMSLSNEDAQFLESRKFSIIEIANALNLPPHKLGDAARTSYASLEMENQAFLDDSIEPWFKTWEQESADKLLREAEKERRNHYIEFNRNELIKADFATRINGYDRQIQIGMLSVDEARAKENMPPLPDGLGEVYYRPLNLGIAGEEEEDEPMETPALPPPELEPESEPEVDPPADEESETDARSRLLALDVLGLQRKLAERTTERFVKRVSHHVRLAAKKPQRFHQFLFEELSDHREAFFDAIGPIVATVHRITYGSTANATGEIVGQWFERVTTELNEVSGRVTADALASGVELILQQHESRGSSEMVAAIFRGIDE